MKMPESGGEVHVVSTGNPIQRFSPHCYIALKTSTISVRQGQLESSLYFEGPVAQESVVDSALLRSNFRPFKPAVFENHP
jgi:hypothetical protein